MYNQIPRSRLRGIKLAAQQSCVGINETCFIDPRVIRQIDMQAYHLGSSLAGITILLSIIAHDAAAIPAGNIKTS